MPPKIIKQMTHKAQHAMIGRKTASTAGPVSVSWARDNPMQYKTRAQIEATKLPHNGTIINGYVEPIEKQTTRNVVSNACFAPPTIIKQTWRIAAAMKIRIVSPIGIK